MWITTAGPTHGSAAIYVHGRCFKIVSTHSAKVHGRRVEFQTTPPSFGVIKIVNLGTRGHAPEWTWVGAVSFARTEGAQAGS